MMIPVCHVSAAHRSADANSSGELDMEEFVAAFKGGLHVLSYYGSLAQQPQNAAV
jgi:hypothetical protein